jgi:hypothetical protein
MNEQFCRVCEYPFKDGEEVVAAMVSRYKTIESDVHYAIEQPTLCLEIFHRECYGDDNEDRSYGALGMSPS